MRQLGSGSDERGVTTVILAIVITCLIAAAGLGIDTGSLAYQRSSIQHSADAGALAIAYDCANASAACSNDGGAITANDFASGNSGGGGSNTATIPGGVARAAGSVQVQITKNVPTKFFGLLGISSKEVGAKARANWDRHPISGTVIPFAVSMCEFSKLPSGTDTVIHTDINDELKEASSYAESDSNLLTPACTVPPGVVLPGNPSTISAFEGGLWLSENEGANDVCNGKVNLEVLELTYGSAKNETCVQKYGDSLSVGMTVFMAVYAPSANYDHGGMRGSGGAIVDMEVLGFAPFLVSSWCLEKTCNRPNISGKFVETSKTEPGFVYGTVGGNFGASKVTLKD